MSAKIDVHRSISLQTAILGLLRLGEILAVLGGGVATHWMVFGTITPVDTVYPMINGFGALMMIIVFQSGNAYVPSLIDNFWTSVGRAVTLWFTACLLVAAGTFLSQPDVAVSRLWALSWVVMVAAGLIVVRGLAAAVLEAARQTGRLRTKVAIIGADDAGLQLYTQLAQFPLSIQLAGIYDDRNTRMQEKAAKLGITIAGKVNDLLTDARKGAFDAVIINLPWTGERRLRELIEVLRTLRVEVQLCPEGLGFVVRNFPLFRQSVATTLGGVTLFTVVRRPLDGWGWLVKRIEDNILILLSLPVVLPLCLLIAALIKLDSPGTILFRQDRVGLDGKTFSIYKFRSMRPNTDADETGAVIATQRRDARITSIGTFLRRTSLDELPQIYNVLRGEMSIIGPRPHARSHDRWFGGAIRQYYGRHRVLPGLTGWAQVNGFRGSIEDPDMIKRRVDHDLFYIENWSLMFDLKILLLTPLALLHRNAY